MNRFEIYKDQQGKFRWRLLADASGVIALSGQVYVAKEACQSAVSLVKQLAPTRPFEIYRDRRGKYRWRL